MADPRSVRDLLCDPSEDAFSMPLTNLCDPHDPLSKYTDALMPRVQMQRPLSLFDHMSLDVVEKWWCSPGSKLLAIPFDTEVSNPKLHNDIKGRILAAVAEITNSSTASVAAPKASEDALKAGLTPTSFIIYNLSETHHQILLQRYVWSSVNISFQVAPLEPTNPDFLFTIKGFTTLENGGVTATVWEVWNDEVTQEFILTLLGETPEDARIPLQYDLIHFMNSMWVKRQDIKSKGNCLSPEFNILARGALIQNPRIWSKVRRFLAKRTYINNDLGQGQVVISPYQCGICHGRDHPRGLCDFPLVEGWNGPKRWLASKTQKGGRARRTPRTSHP